MPFVVTDYHRAILDAVNDPARPSIQIQAVAGSGKTSTLEWLCKEHIKREKIGMFAFNKSIAEELGRRMPTNVDTRTLHSLGFQAWKTHLGRPCKIDKNKTYNLMDALFGKSLKKDFGGAVKRLVGLAKNAADWEGQLESLIAHHDVDCTIDDKDCSEQVIKMTEAVLAEGVRGPWLQIIDFDDMLYLPIKIGVRFPSYTTLILDEAQDVSQLQAQMVTACMREGSRVICVGDEHQAIYGFRGADAKSMANLAETWGCQRLPLSVTYRCPVKVVEAARAYNPDIQPREGAEQGVVEDAKESARDTDFGAGDMVVCRNNAPLIRLGLNLLARNVPAVILGRDIAAGLKKTIERICKGKTKLRGTTAAQLRSESETWLESETQKARDAGLDHMIGSLHDKVDAIHAVSQGCKTADEVCRKLDHLYGETASGRQVTLCTIHKAKGLEADNVWILNPELMPSRFAKQHWQQVQERNAAYVAITRAKRALRYVRSA